MTQIAINSINIAINVNGNLDVGNGNLDAVNVNLGPNYGNLGAMKKQQIAVKISKLLFFHLSSNKKTANCCSCHKKPCKLPIFTANCCIFIAPKLPLTEPKLILPTAILS